MTTRVIGVGNHFRHDDAAGVEVIRRLQEADLPGIEVAHFDGEPAALLLAWEGAEVAYVVDAVRSGGRPGKVMRLEVGEDDVPSRGRSGSTHALGLGEAVELARVLGWLPGRLVLIGIVGRDFTMGEGLTRAVERAVDRVATKLLAEMRSDEPVRPPRRARAR